MAICLLFVTAYAAAQQVMYANLKELLEGRGDTVTTLRVEKRTKKQIYMMGGAGYRITVDENSGMSRYLKTRCYAVSVDTALYVNCRKMRYKSYRFGNWYAPAIRLQGRIFFSAQPLGQLATRNILPPDGTKLGGEIGDAINASGIVDVHVYYELDLESGRSHFVGKERMMQLLEDKPELKAELEQETNESAEVIGRYLLMLAE